MTTHHLQASTQYTDPKVQQNGTITAAFALKPDSISWTELQTHPSLAAVDSHPDYDTYFGGGHDPDGRPRLIPKNFCPVSWRRDRYEFAAGAVVKACDGKRGVSPDQWFARVVLRDRLTGELVVRISAHFVAGIQSLADETPEDRKYTIAAHADCVRTFRRLMVAGGATIGSCDANHTGLPKLIDDPRCTYAKTGATHRTRRIDWVVAAGGAQITSARTVRLGHSDHLGVLATITPAKEAPVTRFVPYAEWSTRPRGATRATHPIGSTRGITAHWEGPTMGAFTHDKCAGKVRGIQSYHRDNRGWADIAYNAVVCPHGYVFEGRGAGVKSAANGNTIANGSHYAVCYLGGVGDGFTDAGRDGFLAAFDWLKREGSAGPERNGHRDHKPTQCPGDVIYRWVRSLPAGAPADPIPHPRPINEEDLDMTPDELRAIVREEIGAALSAPQANDKSVRQNVRIGANARDVARANGKAIEAVAASLGPECQSAVQEALAEGIDVEVTVTGTATTKES